jgi:hypothetical protein
VVPASADAVVGAPLLSERRVVPLPDPDVGRAGFVGGEGSVVLPAGAGVAVVEGLPVRVDVADDGSGVPLRVDVRVFDPDRAGEVSPYARMAVQVDLVEPGLGEVAGSRDASVTLDYSSVPLGYGAGLVERLVVYLGEGCVALAGGDLVCEKTTEVPTVNNTRERTLTFSVVDTDLRDVVGAGDVGGVAAVVRFGSRELVCSGVDPVGSAGELRGDAAVAVGGVSGGPVHGLVRGVVSDRGSGGVFRAAAADHAVL